MEKFFKVPDIQPGTPHIINKWRDTIKVQENLKDEYMQKVGKHQKKKKKRGYDNKKPRKEGEINM